MSAKIPASGKKQVIHAMPPYIGSCMKEVKKVVVITPRAHARARGYVIVIGCGVHNYSIYCLDFF